VVVALAQDITERKRVEETLKDYNLRLEAEVTARTRELREAQEKLVRNEKLAVLGQLAGGVGHELRNPLAVIRNALYYLKLVGANGNEKVREYLGIIESEALTAERIIEDLLNFARIKSVDVETVSASRLVERVLERHPAPPNVLVRVDIPQDLPMLRVDPRQVQQVLGNLVINAYQAMPEGGRLTVSGSLTDIMGSRWTAISVRDTGGGISPEHLKKIFEPLFTTRAKGIGLGLAVSRKLAEANDGRLEVESKVGSGSAFTLFLPFKDNPPAGDFS
jgi:signal transduction histidine kinase